MKQPLESNAALSIVHGARDPELVKTTLGDLLDKQAEQYGAHTAAVFSWQKSRRSYHDLALRSKGLAKSLVALGLRKGDLIAIMAGNCYAYIEAFLAAARIGCPFVVINNTYSVSELVMALSMTPCQMLLIASRIGLKDLTPHIHATAKHAGRLPNLKHVVLLSEQAQVRGRDSPRIWTFSSLYSYGQNVPDKALDQAQSQVRSDDLLNLQFTSGTTGTPKVAMLSHFNLINNGLLVGAAMKLGPKDVVCCPPPLFHCFGLVMGFLASLTHGSTIVFPTDQFEPSLVLDAIDQEQCTTLLGVPTMFIAELEANKVKKYKIGSLRKALAAGSSVPLPLMRRLGLEFGIQGILIAYGMTETSPVTFITSLEDSEEKRIGTVGRVMPHTSAKVVDKHGRIVPRGVPGELCTSGYALQRGYWNNEAKTAEAMKRDQNGVVWMHTGDEGVIDDQGYCTVTGRIKDMIIRGGENIYPLEIEERLLEHPVIMDACVVALKDEHYGEVVGAFLECRPGGSQQRPNTRDLQAWVRKGLGSHKTPVHVFWIGDDGVGKAFAKTASGKHQKHFMRALGDKLVAAAGNRSSKPKI